MQSEFKALNTVSINNSLAAL